MAEYTVTNVANSKLFNFRGVNAVKPKQSQPVLPLGLISTTAENTLLFRFFGQQETVKFGFALFDDGTEQAGSTGDAAVITIDAQIKFLRTELFTDEFDTTWTITITRVYGSSAITGVITEIEFDLAAGSPSYVLGTLTLQRGRLVPIL